MNAPQPLTPTNWHTLSKRARRRIRRDAAKAGAILLPGDRLPDPERHWTELNRRIAEALRLTGESLDRTRDWIAECEARRLNDESRGVPDGPGEAA